MLLDGLDPALDVRAVAAVRKWRYKPVMRDGQAVEQRVAVRIRFAGQ